MAIQLDIFVNTKRLQPVVHFTQGSTLQSFEFYMRDFEIPTGAEVKAYSIGEGKVCKENECSFDNNIVTLEPDEGFFEAGKNLLQIEFTNSEGKELTTFTMYVECEGKIKGSGIDTSDANAASNVILEGYQAYVDGVLVVGTLPFTQNGKSRIYYDGGVSVSASERDSAYVRFTNDFGVNPQRAFLTGSKCHIDAPLSEFGDATASDVRSGKIFTSAAGFKVEGGLQKYSGVGADGTATFNESSGKLEVKYTYKGPAILENAVITLRAKGENFGDATASDVASGKTFTSANGLLLTGTGNIEGSTEENTTTGTAIKTGTLTVDTDCESAEVNTGLSSVDAFILYKAPDTTQHNTHGWIYSEPCTGVMQYSYGSTIKIDWWKEDSNYIEINGGVVTAKRYMPSSTPYPVLAGEYSWMAVGTE